MEEEPKNGCAHPRLLKDGLRHSQKHEDPQSWTCQAVKRRRQLRHGSRSKQEEETKCEAASPGGGHGRTSPLYPGSPEERELISPDTYNALPYLA
ncbi:hypothetical protein BHM03_00004406 [Ensete ventricosum]|nr:hypothetical protein BHM03_00004406 [Ensete ventricosum]